MTPLSTIALLAASLMANEIPLWPSGKMPLAEGTPKPERTTQQGHLTDVSVPALYFYPAPSSAQVPKPCVIICPGGGYCILAYRHEGIDLAEWFNRRGMSAFILKYRVPRNPNGAFCDAQRAVSLVRSRAAHDMTDPRLIGIMGFSAGANLAARTSCNQTRAYSRIDAIDDVSCRPDFSLIIYPWALVHGDDSERHLPLMLRERFPVGPSTPRTFIVQAQDDGCHVENALGYYLACKRAGVPCELHLFPDGGHGYGIRFQKEFSVAGWEKLAATWLDRTISTIEKQQPQEKE